MSSSIQNMESNMGFICQHKQDKADSFYLTSDDDSLLEQFRTAEAEASHFNTTHYMSLESYESGIYNVASHLSPLTQLPKQLSTGTLSSNESAFDHQIPLSNTQVAVTSNDKSLEMNCKALCRDLLKPIANKLAQKVLRKRITKKKQQQMLPPVKQQFKFKVQFTSPNNKSKAKLRVVPNLQQAKNLNSIRVPNEISKLTNNCFSKCGDFVFYNI